VFWKEKMNAMFKNESTWGIEIKFI
jgi:hypothetical protein